MRKSPTKDDDEAFLRSYKPEAFERPSVAVDVVCLTIKDSLLHVLLVKRGEPPFRGRWALPGGFVRVGKGADRGESLDQALARELEEETGLSINEVYTEQLGAFGDPDRDPRMRVISVAYYALVRAALVPLIRAGGDVSHTRWFSVAELTQGESLAFDHTDILQATLDRARADLDRTSIAFELVDETFTIQELRAVHEAIRGVALDPGNFRKKFLRMIEDGLIEPARGKRATASKPASVYRFAQST